MWGPGYGTESNYLRVYVGQLRKKLGDDAARPRLILTEPGIGYRWIAGEDGVTTLGACSSDAEPPITVAIVPHTHWDREWYDAVPDVPHAAREAARHAAADARIRPVVRALPARRADRGDRRLPRDPSRSRAPRCNASRPRGRISRRAVDGPDGRVHGVGRDDRARPAVRHRARLGARRRDAGRLPARHVRPRRADAAAPPARGHGARGRVARRARRGRADRVLVGGARRLARARRVPLRLVLQRARPARRREGPRACAPSTTSRSSARPASARHAADERHRPPDAAAVARPRRRRSERDAGRLRVRRHVARRVPAARSRPTGS